ncbi:MAG: hypothetical protein AAF657_05780 [Acidobacteriota bacterium]
MPPPETTSPDPALLSFLQGCTAAGIALNFDEIPALGGVPSDAFLGHSFQGLPTNITAATLRFRARAGVGPTFNDHISFFDLSDISGCTITFDWQSRFESLTPALTWNPGQTEDFNLDLDSLVPGPVSILSQLQDGDLHVLVDDDSGVDHMILDVTASVPPDQCVDTIFADGFEFGDTSAW